MWRIVRLICVCLVAVNGKAQHGKAQHGKAQDTKASGGPSTAPPVERLANGLRLLRVPSAEALDVSIALAIPTGWQHDPQRRTGCATVLRWFLEGAQRELPRAQRFAAEVTPDLTLLWHTGPRRDAVDRLAFLARVLGGELPLSADAAAIALGGARRESDDQSVILPGSVLQQRAWRTVLRGGPRARQGRGIPEEIGALDRATILARYRSHYTCRNAALVVIGNIPEADWTASRARLVALRAGEAALVPKADDTAPPVVADAPHDLVEGPYVAAVIRAVRPGEPDYLPFVVAMLTMRDAAYAVFRQRGAEWRAEAPAFAFAYWNGDPLVRIHRRGPDWSDATATREDVEEFLARFRKAGVRRSALGPAREEIARTLAVPPFASATSAYLMPRARYLATALCLGWPLSAVDDVGKVTLEDVNRVLRACLEPSRITWFSLRPSAEKKRKWMLRKPTLRPARR